MRHTPGPWRVWKSPGSTWEICETENRGRHSHCASIQVANAWEKEGPHNAALIAAAPSLLKACAAALAGYPGWQKMIHDAYVEATGEQP